MVATWSYIKYSNTAPNISERLSHKREIEVDYFFKKIYVTAIQRKSSFISYVNRTRNFRYYKFGFNRWAKTLAMSMLRSQADFSAAPPFRLRITTGDHSSIDSWHLSNGFITAKVPIVHSSLWAADTFLFLRNVEQYKYRL